MKINNNSEFAQFIKRHDTRVLVSPPLIEIEPCKNFNSNEQPNFSSAVPQTQIPTAQDSFNVYTMQQHKAQLWQYAPNRQTTFVDKYKVLCPKNCGTVLHKRGMHRHTLVCDGISKLNKTYCYSCDKNLSSSQALEKHKKKPSYCSECKTNFSSACIRKNTHDKLGICPGSSKYSFLRKRKESQIK